MSNQIEYKIVVTYGGFLGKLARRLGLRWNHILITQWVGNKPRWVYESNMRGVHLHPFREKDLAWEHQWYVPVKPLTELEQAYFTGYCDGARSKWYALHYWVKMGWRIIKQLCTKPQSLTLIPAETCITFVNAACTAIGRPVSIEGASGLPDDITSSPYWRIE